jgi:hypothetical protein
VKRMLVLVAALAAMLSTAATAATTKPYTPWFHLANRAVYCHVDLASTPLVLGCWRPSSGYVVSMASRSVVHHATTRRFRHVYEDSSPVLRKGRPFVYKGFRCTSDGKAITCRNLHQHGWRLGGGAQRRVF